MNLQNRKRDKVQVIILFSSFTQIIYLTSIIKFIFYLGDFPLQRQIP